MIALLHFICRDPHHETNRDRIDSVTGASSEFAGWTTEGWEALCHAHPRSFPWDCMLVCSVHRLRGTYIKWPLQQIPGCSWVCRTAGSTKATTDTPTNCSPSIILTATSATAAESRSGISSCCVGTARSWVQA